jgi:hypothetical protein
MNIKRVISSIAIAGIVGASTLGIGSGIAEASTAQPNPAITTARPVGWHGGGGHGGFGHGGFGRGGGYGYHGGGYGNPFWHPWGWPWRW